MSRLISRTLSLIVAVTVMLSIAQFAMGQRMLGTSRKKAARSPLRERQRSAPRATSKGRKPVEASRAAGSTIRLPYPEALAWQAALERAGFSAGVIDGVAGAKTVAALGAFQEARGLPVTSRFDQATRASLGVDTASATRIHMLSEAEAKLVGDCPDDWIKKSKAKWLGFESLASIAANTGHCSRKLLAMLNPSIDLDALKPGDSVVVPNVIAPSEPANAKAVEIDFERKLVRALDGSGKPVALFPCSIAKKTDQRPSGSCTVAIIKMNPHYVFKPESWPEVKGINQRLIIPPGPRNPVGVCWIGLSLKGYGIHGTPEPELIGKTGSHGCIRLTNWHVLRLAEMLDVGARVRFVDSSQLASMSD